MSAPTFGKQCRLLTKADFDRVFQDGKRLTLDSFSASVAVNTLGYPRVGFALSKRNAPLAVTRNRLRRQLREHFRLGQAQLSAVDIVLTLRRSAPKPEEATASLQKFWLLVSSRCAKS